MLPMGSTVCVCVCVCTWSLVRILSRTIFRPRLASFLSSSPFPSPLPHDIAETQPRLVQRLDFTSPPRAWFQRQRVFEKNRRRGEALQPATALLHMHGVSAASASTGLVLFYFFLWLDDCMSRWEGPLRSNQWAFSVAGRRTSEAYHAELCRATMDQSPSSSPSFFLGRGGNRLQGERV